MSRWSVDTASLSLLPLHLAKTPHSYLLDAKNIANLLENLWPVVDKVKRAIVRHVDASPGNIPVEQSRGTNMNL